MTITPTVSLAITVMTRTPRSIRPGLAQARPFAPLCVCVHRDLSGMWDCLLSRQRQALRASISGGCAYAASSSSPSRNPAVAATKTFLATAAVLLRLTGAWAEDAALLNSVSHLPARLPLASQLDWSRASETLFQTTHLAAIGRGPTLAIAREAALKLKETCNLHTEAFSGAEFLHGPIALVRPNYPVLVFGPTDEAAPGIRQLCRDLDAMGATLLIADSIPTCGIALPVLPTEQPEADALCLMQSFYLMVVALGDRLGVDIDKPPHLQKITRTT